MLADTYPHWVFDTSPLPDPHGMGEAAVRFLKALRHPKTGRPYQLDGWQERIVRRIYGDTLADGTRRVKNVIWLVSRGARKTTLGAALALMHTVHRVFRVHGGQVVLAAHDREQARIAFEEATGLLSANRKVNAAVRIRNNKSEVVHGKTRATLKAVSSDAAAQNGRTPAFALFDEVHAWKRRDLYDVLKTGLTKSDNTLNITISQAGRGAEGIAHDVFDYARKIARGEIEDEGTLPILFENPVDADPFDEAVWHRANPGLASGYPNLIALRQFAREAANRPPVLAKLKNDHLGIWLESNDTPWLDLATWDAGAAGLLDLDERTGETCWLGVDLGRTDDLTAIVAAFRDPDGGFSLYPWVFAPEETITARADVPYRQWVDAGHLTPSPGAVTSFPQIEEAIRELCQRFDVAEICFDPYAGAHMMQRLGEEGLPVFAHRQGYISMSEPMRAFERAVGGRKVRHGGNPLLRWCVGNVIADMDPAGNIKPNKAKSKDKIDAAVAAVMALGRAEYGETGKSIYENEVARPNGFEVW